MDIWWIKTPINIAEKRAKKMAIELDLNDTEKLKVKTFFEKQSLEIQKLKVEISPESADFNAKMDVKRYGR